MIKYAILLVALAVSAAKLTEGEEKWNIFKKTHNKSYSSPVEEQSRYSIFLQNLEKIESHNKDYDAGLVPYKLGITQFADLLDEEFLRVLSYKSSEQSLVRNMTDIEVPKSINWLALGAVTPVKDQNGCLACWSFSATGALEGQYFRKTDQLISLSQQNLIDCSYDYGDRGCQGGLMDHAFQYATDFGIMSDADYPYQARDGYCRYDPEKSILKVQHFVKLESGNEPQLEAAVGTVGPISVAVDASLWAHYSQGIFNYALCGNNSYSLNHGVLVVGYEANEDGIEYWLVKNSWGTTWGEDGYIRLAKNGRNQCGVATKASYPVL